MASQFNLTIEQGTDYRLKVVGVIAGGSTPFPFQDYTWAGELRASVTNPSALAAFSFTPSAGSLICHLTNVQTTTVGAAVTSGVYDIEGTKGGEKIRVVQGTFTIDREVTKI